LNSNLHIITFDVPYPPSYGGVIDVYFKIKELHKQGIKVHLHCFEYGRAIANQLTDICESVNYYKRKSGLRYMLSSVPYIAITRSSDELMQNLLKDDHPILFEGLHCCYHINDKRLDGRKKIVRSHNIEHDYYESLAKVEKRFWKRTYFNNEAGKLKRFENVFSRADHILAISPADTKYLSSKYKNVIQVPAFHPDEKVSISPGKGQFAFYHGNLEIGENIEASLFLINKVFNGIHVPLIIAGNNPPARLIEEAKRFSNIQLKANITTEEIYQLVKDAQINVLPTFQATGIKLKLLTSLFNGRYCVVSPLMVKGTGLENLSIICDSAADMKKEVIRLFEQPFNIDEIHKREEILLEKFSNTTNAKKIVELL
jgi:hypothetical protein